MEQIPSDILSEHQSASASTDVVAQQTEDEEKAVQLVEKLFKRAKRSRSKFDTDWINNYRFFIGNQWKEKRPTYRHSEVLNFVFSEIQTVVPILTDNRPNIETYPEEPSDYEFSEILTHILRSKWDSNNYSLTLAENIVDMSIYGTTIGHVPWVKEKMNGIGDFEFSCFDVMYFYPDPNCTAIDDNCDYICTAVPTDIGKLKLKYPDKASMIQADVVDMQMIWENRDQIDNVTLKSPLDNGFTSELSRSYDWENQDRGLVVTCYMKSDEVLEETLTEKDPETDIETQRVIYKKKYPLGRKIVTCNKVLLEDVPLEYQDAKFEFARCVDHIIPHRFWGMGEIDQLKSPQIIINKIVSYIMDVLILMGNPIWVISTDSGISAENLFNVPGMVVEKNPGSEARREEGVQLQPFIFQMLQFMSDNIFDKISGIHDVTRGVASSADSSGYNTNLLQEAAQTRLRAKSRNIEYYLKDVGDKMVSRILQYYSIPRIIRITGNENAAKYFKFSVEDQVDESGELVKQASVQEYTYDQAMQQYVPGPIKQYQVKGSLDVRISTGTTLPFAKAQRAQVSERLFDKKVIDAEQLLNDIEYPGRERIIEKLRQASLAAPMQGDTNASPA